MTVATSPRTALISGIGIAGPALAFWMLRAGIVPTLIEKAPRLRTGGYIVDFWGLGYDIAERMGILPDILRAGYHVRELRLVDRHGDRVGGFDTDVLRDATGGRFISLPRSELSAALYRAIESQVEAILGNSISGIEERSDGVLVRFEHGPPRRFDLVIGADGLHSRVRELVFGPELMFEEPLGYEVAAFEVDGYRPRDEDVYVAYSLPGRQIGRFAMRGDRTLFLLVLTRTADSPEDPADAATVKAHLRARLENAGWESTDILAAMDRSPQIYFDRVSQIHLDRWSVGPIALVGDAAVAPSLLAGQGCALAIIAAYVLAGELAHGSVEDALIRYERRLRPFMLSKQGAASRFAHVFAPRTRFGIFVRNQITKAFRVPAIAHWALGRNLRDRFALPHYPELSARAVPAAAAPSLAPSHLDR
jgi:2-polyprenyl-6-methoxyphenol hydroxylase-like FAD-dependent oxidoreductase